MFTLFYNFLLFIKKTVFWPNYQEILITYSGGNLAVITGIGV